MAKTNKLIKGLPGMAQIKGPKITAEDRKSYGNVSDKYSSLVMELSMERMVDGLVEGERSGIELLRVMAPYMFQKKPIQIETTNMDGSIDTNTERALDEYLTESEEES